MLKNQVTLRRPLIVTSKVQRRTFLPIVMGWLGYTAVAAAWTTTQVVGAMAVGAVVTGGVVTVAVKSSKPNAEASLKAASENTKAGAEVKGDALLQSKRSNELLEKVTEEGLGKDKVIEVLRTDNELKDRDNAELKGKLSDSLAREAQKDAELKKTQSKLEVADKKIEVLEVKLEGSYKALGSLLQPESVQVSTYKAQTPLNGAKINS